MTIPWIERKSNEKSNRNGRVRKITIQNHQKKTTTIFWHTNRAGALGKKILHVKVFVTKTRGRQCTKCIESLDIYVTRKEPPNSELNNKLFVNLQVTKKSNFENLVRAPIIFTHNY